MNLRQVRHEGLEPPVIAGGGHRKLVAGLHFVAVVGEPAQSLRHLRVAIPCFILRGSG